MTLFNKKLIVFKFWLLFLFIESMFPWFGWSIPATYVVIVTFVLYFLFFRNLGIFNNKNLRFDSSILLLLSCLWLHNYSISSLIYGFLLFLLIIGLYSLKEEIKADVIQYITKYFAILSLISLVSFLIYRIGIPLPHSVIHFQDTQGLEGYGYIDNYYTFITLNRSNGLRFQSVFAEPGHYTMGLAPLLFLNKYNWKNKYVLILMVAQLFTFSLAGYIVFFVGYLFTSLMQGRFFKTLGVVMIGATILMGFIYSLGFFYDNGIMEELIVNRLIIDGEFASFDRAGEQFSIVFERFLHSSDVYLGISEFGGIEGEGSAGIKPFIYVHGILGLILCVAIYLRPLRESKSKESIGLTIVLLLLLYQNAYPFWFCMLICLVCGNTFMKYNNQISK